LLIFFIVCCALQLVQSTYPVINDLNNDEFAMPNDLDQAGDMFQGGGDDLDEAQLEELMSKLNRDTGLQGRRYTRDIFAVEEDVPYVQCQVCRELVKEATRRVFERREKFKKTKLTEADIVEMLEPICDPVQGDGEWITEFDIVEEKGDLVLEHKGMQGYCEEECKTIAKACENVLADADSELAELLYVNKPNTADVVCTKLTKNLKGSCGKPRVPLPAVFQSSGDNFRPKSDIDIALAEAGKELRKKQEINPDFLRDDL